MQQRMIISKGKKYLVNCPGDEAGVGAGFAVGQLTLKSYDDLYWYIITASGSSPNASVYVSESQLSYYGTSSFYDLNAPYQLLGSSDGNTYQVYLTGTAPNATVTVSQSIYATGSYITSSNGTGSYVILTAKPFLILQSITDFNYYIASLQTISGVTSLVVGQTMLSQSWVHPIY